MNIYTSRINYNGDGIKLDVTVKSATGLCRRFAPTWDMVMKYKSGKYSQEVYTQMYLDILESNYYHIKTLINFMNENNQDIVFVCYCAKNAFCHRILLAKYISGLTKIAYKGEI